MAISDFGKFVAWRLNGVENQSAEQRGICLLISIYSGNMNMKL